MPVRALPARPNLDHLKNEAKALHKAFNQHDPTAVQRIHDSLGDKRSLKLTDAQRAIAREYGFPTWARLRAHVEASGGDTAAISTFLTAAHAQARAGHPPADPLLYLGYSPFHGESSQRDAGLLETARVLLAAGANPNTRDAQFGVPVLHSVTGQRSVLPIGRLLLDAGANPTDGESVFHAAEHFHVEALELLLDAGADLDHVGDWGNAPLYFLLRWWDVAKQPNVRRGLVWLLDHAANPNVLCARDCCRPRAW